MFNKFLLSLIVLISLRTLTFAQSGFMVTGTVADSAAASITNANVTLLRGTDTLKAVTDNNGYFEFKGIKKIDFSLIISYLGYKDYLYRHADQESPQRIDLGRIKLKVDAKKLKEVVIKGQAQAVVFKKDTTEYNVGSYDVSDEAAVAELLKKLPGIDVDKDGNVTSEGKPVTKLRVNGRDFFSGNVKEFISQLPTGIFTKVQIVNDYGDAAAFTGIKKGEPMRQLNLITKPGMDNGVFGGINASGGSNKLFQAGLNANIWKQSKQISGSASERTTKNVPGGGTYRNLGATYNDQIGKKIRFSGNYNYNNSTSNIANNSFSETINNLGVIDNSINKASATKTQNHNFNFNAYFTPDKNTYVSVNGNFAVSRSADSVYSNSQQTGVVKQGLLSDSRDDGRSPNENVNISINRRSDKNHPTFSANFSYGHNTSTRRSEINRIISYYDASGKFTKDSIYNSVILNNTHAENINANFEFSQAVTKKSDISLTYSYSLNRQHNSLLTSVDVAPTGYLEVDSLSSNFHSSSSAQRLDLTYMYNNEKINIQGGINAQRSTLSDIGANQVTQINQTTYNFSPNLRFNYVPGTTYSFNLGYNGSSQAPSVEQLQPIQDTRNLQNVVIGNPNLKPAFSHQVTAGGRYFAKKSKQALFMGLSAGMKQNEIITNTVLIKDTLNTFKQRTTYLNENGSYSAGGNYDWSIPFNIGKTKLNANYSGNFSFSRQVVFADNEKAFNNNRNESQSLGLSTMIKLMALNGSLRYSSTSNHYTVGQGLNSTVSNLAYTFSTNINIKKTSLQINGYKSITKGYNNIGANNPLNINASINQGLLKNNKLSLRFSATDILNQSNIITQAISGNTITNSRAKYISRYFILEARYSISSFGKLK